MSDERTTQAVTRGDLARLAEAHPVWWPADASGRVVVAHLGRGESYDAWTLRRGEAELVARVAHKPAGELPLAPAEELAVLARVPTGIGPRPVAVVEASPGRPVAITSRVPGRMLPAGAWADDELLAEHARVLARLHEGADRSGLPTPTRHDPVAVADDAMAWWRHQPGRDAVSASAGLEPLWPAVRAHLAASRAAFERPDWAFLHGDPAAANVLVDDQGRVGLVDWEWAHVGDTARDLAFIGGPISGEPWYAPLTEAQVRHHAEAYLAARGGPDLDLDALLVRRTAHLLHETFFVSAHLDRVGRGEQAEHLRRQIARLVGA